VKVTFVSLNAAEPLAYGIISLGAALRRAGHEVALAYARQVTELFDDPKVQHADVLAVSATTGLHRVYLEWVSALRRRFPTKCFVMGGPHPTYFPEVIEQGPLDAVCIGEGEESFPEFLAGWAAGATQPPAGFWVRRERGTGVVVRGAERGPVRDLTSLPTPAYDLFYDDRRFRHLDLRIFLATRGCPYRCSYCFNRTLNERYRPYGPLIRTTDPERLADDIEQVRDRWGLKLVWFLDANFVADVRWLERFAAVYQRRIRLPFFCKLRPERATQRIVDTLVQSGCTGVGVGLESGSERLRRDVLHRPVRDAAILEGCRRLKAAGITLMAFSMLGIPGEELDEALRTLALNVACGVDHASATILQPYPGTELARWAVQEGFFAGDFGHLGTSYFDPSPFTHLSEHDRGRITNLSRLFSLAAEFPEVRRHLRWLIARRPNAFYRHLFIARQRWMMNHRVYNAYRRTAPVDCGTPDHYREACRELGLAVDAGPERRPIRSVATTPSS
jgi:anaerobic magnesium-protoporphyrin IX monomethyl ester cyclase